MSVSCRLVARELMLPAPCCLASGEGGETGAVGQNIVHLAGMRLDRAVVRARDREVNDVSNAEPSNLAIENGLPCAVRTGRLELAPTSAVGRSARRAHAIHSDVTR